MIFLVFAMPNLCSASFLLDVKSLVQYSSHRYASVVLAKILVCGCHYVDNHIIEDILCDRGNFPSFSKILEDFANVLKGDASYL